jgi:hypothetical protein
VWLAVFGFCFWGSRCVFVAFVAVADRAICHVFCAYTTTVSRQHPETPSPAPASAHPNSKPESPYHPKRAASPMQSRHPPPPTSSLKPTLSLLLHCLIACTCTHPASRLAVARELQGGGDVRGWRFGWEHCDACGGRETLFLCAARGEVKRNNSIYNIITQFTGFIYNIIAARSSCSWPRRNSTHTWPLVPINGCVCPSDLHRRCCTVVSLFSRTQRNRGMFCFLQELVCPVALLLQSVSHSPWACDDGVGG